MDLLMQSVRPLSLRLDACASCYRVIGKANTPTTSRRLGLKNSDRIQRRYKGYIAPAGEQARPITGYYAEMLKKPLPKVQPLTHTDPKPTPPESPPTTQKERTLEKARIIFGSKTALAERRKEIENASHNVAGVLVPPKPEEPDNCCMSGCVNCVWDMYRDEMEEWAEKSAQARKAMQVRRQKGEGSGSMVAEQGTPTHVAVSMDDDGGGSETNWSVDVDQDNLFDDIPVGIREFMRTEKRLKQMQKEQTAEA